MFPETVFGFILATLIFLMVYYIVHLTYVIGFWIRLLIRIFFLLVVLWWLLVFGFGVPPQIVR